MIGKRISERYEIIKYIGGGGMSRVYLAHDIILDRDVAVKVLSYDFTNEEELKRRFMREALSATSLTHPHIVNIFDVGEDGDIHYLVMEYIEGQTLKEFIVSNGPLSPERALPIMKQLVSAISHAHYNNIVHRDIKPQNILMDHDGNLKITDFGIAMALSATAHTKTNSVLGTVHYLSPEQARGGMATKKSDVYSLGIVFYELLTGNLPFSGESAVSIALKHLQEETPSVRALFPSIPQSLENVILKTTAKDPTFRYNSADEIQEDLSTVLSPERANEDKFVVFYEDEMTRAIPIITDTSKFSNIADTKKHQPIEVEEEPIPVPVKKRKKWPLIIGGLVALLIVTVLLLTLPEILGLKKVEVPPVSGKTEAEAVTLLEELGFKIEERLEVPSDEVEVGKAIRTDPEEGKLREKGTNIKLYISMGKETIKLDNYQGRDYDSVVAILEKHEFRSIKKEDVFSPKPKGEILEQSFEENHEVVPSETDLVFQVSKGKEMIVLKDLSGFDESELKQYAASSGLNVFVIDKVKSSSVREGHVISQSPLKDAEIEKGGKVEVVMSDGTPEKPVKHLVQTITIEYTGEQPIVSEEPVVPEGEAEEELPEQPEQPVKTEKVPQKIRIYVQDRNNTMTDPYDEFMITETTMKVITIELEEGQRGAYRIERDSTVIAEKTFDYGDTN